MLRRRMKAFAVSCSCGAWMPGAADSGRCFQGQRSCNVAPWAPICGHGRLRLMEDSSSISAGILSGIRYQATAVHTAKHTAQCQMAVAPLLTAGGMQVLFSPYLMVDGTAQVSVVGPGICKSYQCADVGGLKPVPIALSRRPDQDFTCHVWLAGGEASCPHHFYCTPRWAREKGKPVKPLPG